MDSDDITGLARRWSEGDDEALERLIAATYPKLRMLARRHVRSDGGDPTIDATALVHEAYLRLARGQEGVWPSRAHFFAFCSTVMRRVLIDYARKRAAEKRGGARVRVPLSEIDAQADAHIVDILLVEDALEFLSRRNERMARVVECRFYGGLSIDETAEALGTSQRTVVREWTRARAYLLEALDPSGAPERPGDPERGSEGDAS